RPGRATGTTGTAGTVGARVAAANPGRLQGGGGGGAGRARAGVPLSRSAGPTAAAGPAAATRPTAATRPRAAAGPTAAADRAVGVGRPAPAGDRDSGGGVVPGDRGEHAGGRGRDPGGDRRRCRGPAGRGRSGVGRCGGTGRDGRVALRGAGRVRLPGGGGEHGQGTSECPRVGDRPRRALAVLLPAPVVFPRRQRRAGRGPGCDRPAGRRAAELVRAVDRGVGRRRRPVPPGGPPADLAAVGEAVLRPGAGVGLLLPVPATRLSRIP